MRDDRSIPLPTQLIDVAGAAFRGGTAVATLASLALVVLAGTVAPGNAPGAWTWLRLLTVWLLVAVALAQIAGAAHGRVRPASPVVTWGALLAAVAVSLTFSALTTALTALGVVLLLLTAPGSAGQPGAFWVIVATVTPLWVWSAFEAWDRWLLMLAPIAAVGLVSMEHATRAGRANSATPEKIAAWIGLLALTAATLLVALLAGIDASWITTAAVAVTVLGTGDLALARLSMSRVPPLALPGLALLAIALGWMAGL